MSEYGVRIQNILYIVISILTFFLIYQIDKTKTYKILAKNTTDNRKTFALKVKIQSSGNVDESLGNAWCSNFIFSYY